MEQQLFFQNSRGIKLNGILSNPSPDTNTPVIILAHGFTSNKNTKGWVLLTKLLNKENIATFRIDLFAHGESEGNFEDITITEAVDDILNAIKFLKSKGYKKIGLVGSSFGGMASTMTASQTKDLFILGLKSPVSDYEEIWTKRRTPEEIKKWKETNTTEYKNKDKLYRLKYAFYEDFKNNQAYKVALGITTPTIIVHGDSDTVVPVSQSIKISQLLPHCKLVLIKGADHRYTGKGELDQVVHAFNNFILEHV